MLQSDIEYYRRRAAAERELARAAERANVAAIHQELAYKYEALAEESQVGGRLRAVA